MSVKSKDPKALSTKLIHTGDGQDMKKYIKGASVPEVLPIYMSSVFAFDDVPSVDAIYEGEEEGYIYTRIANPGTDSVSGILAAAEGGEDALVFASGMSAIVTTILSYVQAGDHIISSPVLYGGVYSFFAGELQRLGIEVTFVDLIKEDIESYIKPNTKVVYSEIISNPLMEVPDIREIGRKAGKHGLAFIVDNTFATPVIARPLDLGADAVVYSATKYLGGHSDLVGGAVVGKKEEIDKIRPKQVLYGGILSPFNSWLLARSLRTLDLRIKKHSENALKLAEYLENHSKVEKVFYPGLKSSPSYETAERLFSGNGYGGMLSVNLVGGEQEASLLIQELQTIKFVPSLAGTATTVSYSAKTSHRMFPKDQLDKLGITMGQLRFSVGLEDADDLIVEIDQALSKIAN